MQTKIEVEYKHVVEAFGNAAKGQVKFVAQVMANDLAFRVQRKLKELLPQKFDRPTPFTVKQVLVEKAKKADGAATVFFPDSQEGAGRATSVNRPLEYIRPGADGTASRNQKRSEYLLTRAGFLPNGWVMVPGSFMKTKLDAYGNVPGQYYRQVIRSLQIKTKLARPISKASSKRAARMGVETEFFAVAPGANKLGKNAGYLPSGVYQRSGPGGRKLVQYFLFVKKAGYKQRINLRSEALKVVAQDAQAAFKDAIATAQGSFLPGLKVS